ncbi:MAG TPA: GDP-L-fucose synthase [Magnetovibrio sp.]
MSLAGLRVWVAGHRGMVGSALVRRLATENCEILTATRAELDLTRQADVERWMAEKRPDVVFMAAARVGGIHANNSFPVEFLSDNMVIEMNILRAATDVGVRKLMFLGSSCQYPRAAEQPIAEETLLTGPLEPTNQWYAIAKIAGIKMVEACRQQLGKDFISVTPTNLYGIGDNFDPEHSHVIPALMRRLHEAKLNATPEIVIWGSGTPRREFMNVDDAADACIFLMKNYSEADTINVGTGSDIAIKELAECLAGVIGYEGRFSYDTSKPDGMPRKLLDSSRLLALGWKPKTTLQDGLEETYRWFQKN